MMSGQWSGVWKDSAAGVPFWRCEFGGGRRHGNDSYIKAASDEREKLLNTQLKSICQGC